MNRQKFSFIGHSRLRFANPIGEARIARLIELLPLRRSQSVVDVGAGKGEFLRRLVRRRHVKGVALDILKPAIPSPGIRVVVQDAKEFFRQPGRFDAAACIGSTHALGGYGPTLKALRRQVKPGGLIVIGEGYWMKKPAAGYLKFLEARSSDYFTHAGNIARAERLGLIPLWCTTSTADEWDEYEWSYSSAIESYAAAHPDDPDSRPMLRRIRAWRRARLEWGRDTLGFGLYVYRNGPSL